MERFIVLLSQPIGRIQWHKKGIKAHWSWYVAFIGQKCPSKFICSLLAYKQFLQTLKGVGTYGLYIWQEDSIVYWMSENPLQVGATFEHLPQYSKFNYGRRPGSPCKTLLPHHLWAHAPKCCCLVIAAVTKDGNCTVQVGENSILLPTSHTCTLLSVRTQRLHSIQRLKLLD